jgi:hypothetical protein
VVADPVKELIEEVEVAGGVELVASLLATSVILGGCCVVRD